MERYFDKQLSSKILSNNKTGHNIMAVGYNPFTLCLTIKRYD